MHITRTRIASTGAAALVLTAVTSGTANADIGPICNSNPTGVEARAGNALRSEPLQSPTIVPGRMSVDATANPWNRHTDWSAQLHWRNVRTGERGFARATPLSTGRVVFNNVPTAPGDVAFTVRANKIGINPPVIECHDVVTIR